MVPDANDEVVRGVGSSKTNEDVGRLVEIESGIVELIFSKQGQVSGHKVP